MDNSALAAVVLADLEAIVERTRDAYLDRVPRLRHVEPTVLDDVIEATRLALRQFCRYYVDGTLDASAWTDVRDATVAHAGRTFSQAEILDIVDIAHGIAITAIAALGETRPDLTADDLAAVKKAMDRYVAELAEQEDRLSRLASPDRLHDVLEDLEADGADLQ